MAASGVAMASLYRSATMSYVRLLMTEETSYATIRQLGHWGHLHVVDLSASNPQAALSERVVRLKKRIAQCAYWEKRLDSLRELMAEYGVQLPLEDEVDPQDATAADVLDSCTQFVEPLEAAISAHIVFRREQERSVGAMTEQLYVLDAVLHPTKTRQQRAQDTNATDEDHRYARRTRTLSHCPLSPGPRGAADRLPH